MYFYIYLASKPNDWYPYFINLKDKFSSYHQILYTQLQVVLGTLGQYSLLGTAIHALLSVIIC